MISVYTFAPKNSKHALTLVSVPARRGCQRQEDTTSLPSGSGSSAALAPAGEGAVSAPAPDASASAPLPSGPAGPSLLSRIRIYFHAPALDADDSAHPAATPNRGGKRKKFEEDEEDLETKVALAKRDAQGKRKQIPPFVQKLSR